ncbi:MAG: AraC family transcriptional regulator, partial [Verrucomicrobiales bacterium]|nr:AraC family transcriptional regulator [Verrucomicrobiales bacterium]
NFLHLLHEWIWNLVFYPYLAALSLTIAPIISTKGTHHPMIRLLKKTEWFHPDGFPLVVERRDPQEPFGPHRHEFSEIVIVTGGQGVHVIGQETWMLSTGDVFVISGARAHDYRDLQKLQLINILYDVEKLRMDWADLNSLPGFHALFTLEPAGRKRNQFKSRLRLPPKDLAIIIAHVDQLEAELKARKPGFGFVASALFMQIVGFLSRCHAQSAHPDSQALLRIARAISHLESHHEQPLNLDELAKIAQMSRRSLLRSFRAAMGNSPIAHLIELRLNRAASLLRRTNESVTDIAFRVGFTDSNYFSRQFRKVMGVSPRDYRAKTSSART